ncbi:MAG: hypothetical protein M3Q98_06030, partial [Actinomycetota bacterium]|nr:hypothetical protein [Actinomycetota bacterium]
AISVEPWAINTQNAACFSINCFFDHTSNTSHQRCCNDRSNSPSPSGAAPHWRCRHPAVAYGHQVSLDTHSLSNDDVAA